PVLVERRLFTHGTVAAPEAQGALVRVGAEPVSLRPGTLLRIEVSADAPPDRPCELRCPLPVGVRMLVAAGGTPSDPLGGLRTSYDFFWRSDAPRPDPRVRIEAWAVAASGDRAWWETATIVAAG